MALMVTFPDEDIVLKCSPFEEEHGNIDLKRPLFNAKIRD